MYFKFFGLRIKPFNTTPDPEFLYLSPGHKEALGSLIYGIREKKGFIAVTGQVGLGKTTILRSFLNQNNQANQETVYLLNPNLSFTSLLKTLLRELGHDPIEGDDAEVLEQLHFVLIEKYREGRTVILLIDEAQNMPVDTLEHLRMLSNLETPKDKLIQIVLLGQPELDDLLDRYELRQLRQRIAVRAIIHPLSKQESFQYIQHRLDKAGGEGKKCFTNSALALIVREAKGIPRRLNILCDNALVTAFGYNKSLVTAKIAKEVISDLTGQPSHSLWKLVPLVAGALVLALAFMPMTYSHFFDTPPLQEIGPLLKEDGDNPNQDLVNLREHISPPVQDDLTLQEMAQSFLPESVPAVLEEFREMAIFSPDSNTTPLNSRTDIDPNNQEDLVLAKDALGDFKDAAPVVTEESEVPIAPEAATPIIQYPQQELSDLSRQGEGLLTDEAHSLFIEETPLVQDETETPSASATETNTVQPNPENHNIPSAQLLVEEPKNSPKQDSPPSISVATTLAPLQKITSKKPDIGASPSPVTRIVKEGDTLAKLLHDVYGSASPSTLRFVLDHNRHIANVQKMYPGQQIIFPPLKSVERKEMITKTDSALLSDKGEKFISSTKIFARSSTETELNAEKVEVKRDPPYAVAIVQKGDTLEKLVKAVYGSSHPLYIQYVLDYNPQILNPRKISPGQDIAFPRIAEKVKALTNQSFQANSPE